MVAAIQAPRDNALSIGAFLPLIPVRFSSYLRDSFRTCISNILGYVRVLAPEAPLDRLAEESAPAEFMAQVNAARLDLAELTEKIVDQIVVDPPPPAP